MMITTRLHLFAVVLLLAVEARSDMYERSDAHNENRSTYRLRQTRQAKTTLGMRLQGGSVTTEGRVEVYRYPYGWGTVCDDAFEDADAEVACRMLGFSGGEAVGEAAFGEGTGDIVLDQLECTGSELDFWDCPRNRWGNTDCTHAEDAGVRCVVREPAGGSFEIRLVGGSESHEGRLEVLHDGQWGTVCDDWWEAAEAQVVCAQLGMTGGEVAPSAQFGEGTGPIFLDSVDCDGEEEALSECAHSDWGVHDCSHSEDVGVTCDAGSGGGGGGGGGNEDDYDTTIRLVNGNGPHEGRVEIFHDGIWGTVCDDEWDNIDATVVCRSIGYTSGVGLEDNEHGSGSGRIWLDEVHCHGSERRLSECPHNPWGRHDCSHYEDAGVTCS